MAFSKLFSYKSVDMPNKSGHDLFHRRYMSGDVGTLTPSFVDFLIPGDKVDLSGKFDFQLPPMATDFFGRINLRTELFFVPCRVIYGGWKDFITYPAEGIEGPAPEDPNYHNKYLPGAKLSSEGAAVSVNKYYSSINNSEDIGAYWAITESQLEKIISDYRAKLDVAIDNNDTTFFVNDGSSSSSPLGAGSLLDYLRFKVNMSSSSLDVFPYMVRMSEALSNPELPTLIYNNYLSVAAEYRSDGFAQYVTSNGSVGVYEVSSSSSVRPTTPDSNEFLVFEWTRFREEEDEYSDPQAYVQRATIYPHISAVSSGEIIINNILAAVSYHKIFDDWYRDPRIMKPLFPSALRSYGANEFLQNIAYIPKFSGGFDKKFYQGDQLKFYDGSSLFDLRQRLWQKDYFTTMTAQPQAGDAISVSFDVENGSGEFTIASLRVANAMQQWLERNNLVSPRYGDVMFAQYGVYPSDATTDRSIYLGSSTLEVYNKAVYQQGSFSGNGANPFDSIGAKYGAPVVLDSSSLCNNYEVKEHGFLMAITSLVPTASYGSGTSRFWHYDTIADIAFPLLQGVGDQEVYAREIVDSYSGEGDKTVIGYQERYIEYKIIEDSVHGRLRDGQNLSSFMLQRTFSTPPELGTAFLEIPKDYLNQVGAVNADVSEFGYWGAITWDYRKVSSLSSANSTPTLGRMVDVHTISVPKGGTRL